MHYALLIYQTEPVESPSPEELEAALAGHRHLQTRAKAERVFRQASELMSAQTATTVRSRGGKTTITDGPFAETKEQFIGLYVLDCADLDEAIAYAELIPHVRTGSVEIRRVAYHEVDDGGAA